MIGFVVGTLKPEKENIMKILNLTQHVATQEQIAEGVVEPSANDKKSIQSLLTFDHLPTWGEIIGSAEELANIASSYGTEGAMIGGAPYLMAPLERALGNVRIIPFYAFSIRESVEETAEDGSIIKRNVFRHKGFVPAL